MNGIIMVSEIFGIRREEEFEFEEDQTKQKWKDHNFPYLLL